MSIYDESWERPICDFCGLEIPYGEKLHHYDGKCLRHFEEQFLKSTQNMKTLTSNTQATALYSQAADDILEILERLGFSSDLPLDQNALHQEIVDTILKRVEGNTFYNYES